MVISGKYQKGFTLVELMIVTALVGILVAIAIPNYLDLKDKTTWMVARENMDVVRSALASYVANKTDSLYPSGTLDFSGVKTSLGKAVIPNSEKEAKLVTGSFVYTSTDGLTFSFQANCANRGNDLLIVSPAGVRPFSYDDYEGYGEDESGVGHYRIPKGAPKQGQ